MIRVQVETDVDSLCEQTTLHARFHDLALVRAPDPATLPASVTVDVASGVVSLSTDQLDGAVATFLSAFGLVVRAVVMARHRAEAEAEGRVMRRRRRWEGLWRRGRERWELRASA